MALRMLDRTRSSRLLCLIVCVLIAGSSWAQQNVLLIIADDMGADSTGLYSSADTAPTPTINALAGSGVRFSQAWANPTCSPTRSCLLTGRHGLRTGVGFANGEIPIDEFTTARALGAAGYSTACIGKWHLGGPSNGGDDNPLWMGFDFYQGSPPGAVSDYYQWTKVTKSINGTSRSETITRYATTETVDDAIAWIDTQGNRPWFCQLAFNAPHDPFQLPPTDLHQYGNATDTPTIYRAMIQAMDTEMGRMFASIDPAVLRNTHIIFLGDNGTPRSVVPGVVRGWKLQLYQGGVHVPLIIRSPSVVSPGRTQSTTVHAVDLFSTVLELAGVDPRQVVPAGVTIDSISLRPYLVNPNQADLHQTAFTESFRDPLTNQDGETIRNQQFKLIRYFRTSVQEMYNLSDDPLESNNLLGGVLSGEEQNQFNRLSDRLDQIRFGGGSNDPQIIEETSFEDGLGIWIDGGSDCRRETNDARFAGSGDFCVRLRDGSNTSNLTSAPVDLSNYSGIEVRFYLLGRQLESNEGLSLQISVDGGGTFDEVDRWTIGSDLVNNQSQTVSTTFNGNLSTQTVLRFACLGSDNRDFVYLDDLQITAVP